MDLILAFAADLIFGDPYSFPHPVKGIGLLISNTERILRKTFKSPAALKLAGVFMAVFIPFVSYAATDLVLKLAQGINPFVFHTANVLLIYTMLSVKSLGSEAMKVYGALKQKNIELARKNLSHIVGRDTKNLDEGEIIRAAVETVAENTVDGVLSPLCFVLLGGAPLGMAYKAINTLDSMVGYKNREYIHLGWASARLDDAANFIPARVSGLVIAAASSTVGYDGVSALKIFFRDRLNHTSPNAGHPEAAFAGALGLQLGGPSTYFGKKVIKPTIGDGIFPIRSAQIKSSVKIMRAAALLSLILGLLLRLTT